MTERIWLYCSDFPEAGECCESCHDDFNHGQDGLIEHHLDEPGPEVITMICCNVYNHLEPLGIKAEMQKALERKKSNGS